MISASATNRFAAQGILRVRVLNLLESHLAVQFGIERAQRSLPDRRSRAARVSDTAIRRLIRQSSTRDRSPPSVYMGSPERHQCPPPVPRGVVTSVATALTET